MVLQKCCFWVEHYWMKMSNVRTPLEVNCLQVDHLVDGMPHSAKDGIATRNYSQQPALSRLQPKTAIYLQRVALAEALYRATSPVERSANVEHAIDVFPHDSHFLEAYSLLSKGYGVIYMYTYISYCLSVCLSVCLYLYIYIYIYIYIYVYIYIYIYI